MRGEGMQLGFTTDPFSIALKLIAKLNELNPQ